MWRQIALIFFYVAIPSLFVHAAQIDDIVEYEPWRKILVSGEDTEGLCGRALDYVVAFNNSSSVVEGSTLRRVAASFSGLIWVYNTERAVIAIREAESKLSRCLSTPEEKRYLLLNGAPELEVVIVKKSNLEALRTSGVLRQELSAEQIANIKAGSEISYTIPSISPPPVFYRLPSAFEGTKFLVGGERRSPGENQAIYTLNYDSTKYPDILGRAEELPSLIAIPTAKFQTVEFDFLDEVILLDEIVLKEYYRILSPGGSFLFRTSHQPRAYYDSTGSARISEGTRKLQSIFGKDPKQLGPRRDEAWFDEGTNYFFVIEMVK